VPFCGWIKEAHVGRPQRGVLAYRLWLFCFSLFFVFFFFKEKLKGGQACLAPTTLTLKQNITNGS
jgi:hypothetical protein